jgi:hypothetical protein
MQQSLQYSDTISEAFQLEAEGEKPEGVRNRAEWARMMAVELRKQGSAWAKTVTQPNGEVVPLPSDVLFSDTLTVPDLASVEASLDRSRLLLQPGTDVAAMALDAANSIQARSSLERMLAHQLATAHKVAMEQMGQVDHEESAGAKVKRINAAVRCMNVYQQGMLALHKLRQGGQQRITVQYVNVSEGGQAVIGNVDRRLPETIGVSDRRLKKL